MKHNNPITITNWSPMANAYRNMRRPEVDDIFKKAEKLEATARYKEKDRKISKSEKADEYNKVIAKKEEARQLWRTIITHSNTLN